MHYGSIFLTEREEPLFTYLGIGVFNISDFSTDNERFIVGKGYLILAKSFFRETMLPIRFLSKNYLPSAKMS